MSGLADLIETGDVYALHTWLSETGTLDIAEELTRLDPEDKGLASACCPAIGPCRCSRQPIV